ncbi:unnamed protein product [marine sediment metagenome]|uniref:Putative zinc-finger domain-containing protein n=1 Tax=marine sediment metagenome TaxID=412755 RepID=X1FX12_9ZZZZ
MDCRKIHTLIADYLCGALPPEQADEARRHIESCPACRAELDAHEAAWKLAGEIRDVKPAPGFTRAVRERLAQRRGTARRRRAFTRTTGFRIAASAAACVLVAFALFLILQRPEQTSETDLADETEIIRNLDLLVNLDTLADNNLKPGDVDILKNEEFDEAGELARRGIPFEINNNGAYNGNQ